MQNRNFASRRTFIKAIVASSAGLVLARAGEATAQSSSDTVVEDLASKVFVGPMSNDDINSWTQSCQALNPNQVEMLDDLLAESLSKSLRNKGDRGAKLIANAYRVARREVNKTSKDLYKITFNKLDSSQRNAVFSVMEGSSISSSLRAEVSAQGACSCFDYPYTTNPGGSATSSNGGTYISASQVRSNCGDCDWDVSFPVNRLNIKYTEVFSQMHYNDLGGRFIYRRTPTNTRVVFG